MPIGAKIVLGGVINRCLVGEDRFTLLSLVVLTQADANTSRRAEVQLRPPAGAQLRIYCYEVLQATATAESGFVHSPFRFHVPHDERWIIAVIGGGTSGIALALRIAYVSQGSLTTRC